MEENFTSRNSTDSQYVDMNGNVRTIYFIILHSKSFSNPEDRIMMAEISLAKLTMENR